MAENFDISQLTNMLSGAEASEAEKKPEKEVKKYSCEVKSSRLSGKAELSVEKDAVIVSCALSAAEIRYSSISRIENADYIVNIYTYDDAFAFSKLGVEGDMFFENVWDRYNDKVLEAFFVKGEYAFTAKGNFSYSDGCGQASGKAFISLYDDCVCLLPADDTARRIPLCFAAGIEKGDYSLKITLDTGDAYEVSRLGLELDNFERLLTQNMRAIRASAVEAVRGLDNSLTQAQAEQAAELMPQGAAASFRMLSSVSPSLVGAAEKRIAESRAAETYGFFSEYCDPMDICVGFQAKISVGESSLFIAAPKLKEGGGAAAVEFALAEDTSAATFIYRFNGGWLRFFRAMNHALEAISFKREVIRLSNEELLKPEKELYAMAVRRTAALRFLRECFCGRALHYSFDSWKKELVSQMEG